MSLFNRVPQEQFGKPLVSNKPAYQVPAGMPMFDRSTVVAGSRGGAVIWVMREAFMPTGKSSQARIDRLLARRTDRTLTAFEEAELMKSAPDKDGFAVFGRFPRGFLSHVLRHRWLGADVRADDILHVCSGTLSATEKWTVDLRAEARPRVRASGTALPFRSGAFKAIMLDPPYSDQYARDLYGVENPRPSWLLKEAARVVRPGGRIGLLHVAVPFPPPDCNLLTCYGVTTGVGYRIRAFTVFQRRQAGLLE